MAEKIIDIKLNAKEAQKELEKFAKTSEQLEDDIQDLNQELLRFETALLKTKKGTKQYDELNKKIKLTRNSIKKETLELRANNKQKTRLNKQTTQLNKKLKEQAKNHNEVSKGLTKTVGGTGALDRATGGLFSSFQGLTKGIGASVRSFGLLKTALIASGVGAFVVVLGSLVAAFTSTEEGQNKVTKGLNQAKAVFANVTSLLTKLGNKLLDIGESFIEAFQNPKQLLIDFGTAFQENITERFNSYIDTLGLIASAVKKVFSGDFAGAMEDAKNAGKESLDVITGISNSYEKTGDAIANTVKTVKESVNTLAEDIKADVDAAGELSDMIAKADKIDRELLVKRQKDNIRINDLRTKAYNTERFNEQERIEFLREAIKIEDAITNREIEAAKLRANAKIAENNLVDEVRKEDFEEQAKLEAKVFQLEAAKINRQREVSNQEQMILRKDKKAKQKIIDDAEQERKDKAQEVEDILSDIERQKEDEKAESELEKINLEEQRILAELDRLNATEEQKTQITQFFADKRFEIEKNNKDKEKELDELVLKAKLQQGKRALGLIAEVAGNGSAIGKAAAVASATISGIEGVQNAFSTAQESPITAINPSYPFVQAGLAGAFSAVQIAKILQTKTPNTGKGSGVSTPSGGGRGAVASTPPDFNVVGATPINQLAESIGQQQDKPVKAFVVSTEISTQQELDRNTEDNAQIG